MFSIKVEPTTKVCTPSTMKKYKFKIIQPKFKKKIARNETIIRLYTAPISGNSIMVYL